MNQLLEATKDVWVLPISCNFWYSVYGFEQGSHEDLFLSYQNNAKPEKVFFQIYTKGHFRDLSKATDELTTRMLQEDCDAFGLSLESLLVHENIKMAINANNTIFHPAEYLDVGVVREAAGYFCRQHKISAFVKLHFPRKMSRSQALQSFREDQRRNKEMEGKQYRVLLSPQFLIDFQSLPGKEVLNLEGIDLEKVECGYREENHYYVRFKDGTEKLISQRVIKEVK